MYNQVDYSERMTKEYSLKNYFLALSRISLGWIFLWAFLDKTFGLGYTTTVEASWTNGGNPIYGYLTYGTSGPFAEMFQGFADSTICQWLFMMGLLGIGLSLILGIGLKVTAYAATLLLMLMYISALPFVTEGSHNPLVDDHIVYAFFALYIGFTNEDHVMSLRKTWSKLGIVKKYPLIK
ncbi:MAG: hypothetical protein H8D44_00100 [Actinobacteria bacterium]|nr:hypothetical protein [Actinomycetota bacterium]